MILKQIAGKCLALTLTLALLLSLFVGLGAVAFATDGYSDVPASHWGHDAITEWSTPTAGILHGNGDGTFAPDSPIKALDLDLIVARLLGKPQPPWTDSPALTRETAAKVVASAFGLAPVTSPASPYSDDADIDVAHKPYVYALKTAGLQQGVGGNAFAPKSTFTRAEILQTIYNGVDAIVDENLESSAIYAHDLVIRKPGVHLKNATVNGDVIIGQGVGEGNTYLDDVTVNGRVIVFGGGRNSLHITGTSVVKQVVAAKVGGNPVRVVVDKTAKVTIVEVTANANVAITGNINTLIAKENATISAEVAGITNVTVESGASLVVDKNSVVAKVEIVGSDAKIRGVGEVKAIIVAAETKNVVVDTSGSKVTNNSTTPVKNSSGRDVIGAGSTGTSSGAGNSGSGGSSSSGSSSSGGGNTGDDTEYELAKWAGSWNPVHDYLDDPGLSSVFQEQFDALTDAQKTAYGVDSADDLIPFSQAIAKTDFGSFVIQGDKITFYDQNQTQQNPSGTVLETVTYTYKGIKSDVWGTGTAEEEAFDWYAFEGDREGDHQYLLLESADRDTPDGPLHFHMRYGSKGFEDLLLTPTDNYRRWAPTIVSYDTTIAELLVFMSGDED
jgi:Zn/Cd-binding protein ZinT